MAAKYGGFVDPPEIAARLGRAISPPSLERLIWNVAEETQNGLFVLRRSSIHAPPSPLAAAAMNRFLHNAPPLLPLEAQSQFSIKVAALSNFYPHAELTDVEINVHMARLNKVNSKLLSDPASACPHADKELLEDDGVTALVHCFAVSANFCAFMRGSVPNAYNCPALEGLDFSWHRLVLIPWHVPGHWILLVLDLWECKIHVYDSLRWIHDLKLVVEWLKVVDDNLKKPASRWQVVTHNVTAPQQYGSVDCGVFALAFARCIANGVRFDFCQGSMDNVRQRLLWELVQDHLQGSYHVVEK
jgi:hypothetical protein